MKINKGFYFFIHILMAFMLSATLSAQVPGLPPRDKSKHIDFIEMNKAFHVMGIRTGKLEDGMISIDFIFNKILDTSSLNSDTMLVNGTAVDIESIKYAKEGNAFRIYIPNDGEEINISFTGLLSENGEPLPPIIIYHGIPCSIYNFRSQIWQKY